MWSVFIGYSVSLPLSATTLSMIFSQLLSFRWCEISKDVYRPFFDYLLRSTWNKLYVNISSVNTKHTKCSNRFIGMTNEWRVPDLVCIRQWIHCLLHKRIFSNCRHFILFFISCQCSRRTLTNKLSSIGGTRYMLKLSSIIANFCFLKKFAKNFWANIYFQSQPKKKNNMLLQ